MPQRCITCSMPRAHRETVSRLLQEAKDGTKPRSIASVAREVGLGAHALHRHVRSGHEEYALTSVVVLPDAVDVQVGTLAARLLGLADQSAAVRRQAALDGHRGDVLKAVEVESRTLALLLSRIGLTDTSSVELLRDAGLLARAIGNAARESREVAAAVLTALEDIGGHGVADDLRKSLA